VTPRERAAAHPQLMLFAVCASATAMFMAITNVFAALPSIGAKLGSSQSELQWTADCYPLVLASLLLPAGVLADRFGRRTFLITGLSILSVSLLAASEASSPTTLIMCLCAAGLGSGLSFPSTLATITGAVNDAQRSTAVALWASAVPLGGVSGALLAGLVIQVSSYSTQFVVTGIIAATCLVLCVWVVPETRDASHASLDMIGAVLSAGAVASLVVGLTVAPTRGWHNVLTVSWLVGGAVLFSAFIQWELRTAQPLLDIRLFRIRAFSTASATMLLLFAGLYALVFLSYQWEAYVLGYNSIRAGVGLAPFAALMLPFALAGSKLGKRVGTRPVISMALCLALVGCIVLSTAALTQAYWTLAVGIAVFGGGIGLAAGPGTVAISSHLPAARQGVASAVNDLSRELGATFGVAVVGTAFNAGYRHHIRHMLNIHADPLAQRVITSPAEATRAIEGSGRPAGYYHHVVTAATNSGWAAATLTLAAAFTCGLVLFRARYPELPSRERRGQPAQPQRDRQLAQETT